MEQIKFSVITEKGMEETVLDAEATGQKEDRMFGDAGFETHFANPSREETVNFLDTNNKVCIKTTITSVSHPFQTKFEVEKIKVKIPLNGWIITDGKPVAYRRSVKYTVYAEVCYPVDLLLKNVEKCAKQGAIAAAAAAVTGNFPAATVAFQAAFLACMALSDANDANKIDIRIAGETEHGPWTPV